MSTEQQEGGAPERVPLLGGLLGGGLTSTLEWFPRSKGMAGWDVRESCVLIGLLQLVVAFILHETIEYFRPGLPGVKLFLLAYFILVGTLM